MNHLEVYDVHNSALFQNKSVPNKEILNPLHSMANLACWDAEANEPISNFLDFIEDNPISIQVGVWEFDEATSVSVHLLLL